MGHHRCALYKIMIMVYVICHMYMVNVVYIYWNIQPRTDYGYRGPGEVGIMMLHAHGRFNTFLNETAAYFSGFPASTTLFRNVMV